MFGAVVLPTKVSIALSGRAAREKKEKVFLIFLLLLAVCCGKIAANYGVTGKKAPKKVPLKYRISYKHKEEKYNAQIKRARK